LARPYAQLDIETLEGLFERVQDEVETLQSLLGELSLRKTRRARALLRRVAERLDLLADDSELAEDEEEGLLEAGLPLEEVASTGAHAEYDVRNDQDQVVSEPGWIGTTDCTRSLLEVDEQAALIAQDLFKLEQAELALRESVADTLSDTVSERALIAPASTVALRVRAVDEAREPADMSRWHIEGVDLEPLAPAGSDEEFELHLAACEWDMDPAILITGPEDIQARVHWQDVLDPFEHQIRNLITFCRRAPVALLADDVGLGKTISAGLILSELRARGKVARVLVVVPKTVLLEQWKGELAERFRIDSSHGRGADLSTLLVDRSVEVVITTYDSARNRLSEIRDGAFDMLILDEAHKLRNLHGTGTPPRTAVEFRKALCDRKFRYVLMLTATPIQNRLWDLYSLVDLLTAAKGHENPLGSPNDFARKFIADGRATARVLVPSRKPEFRRILGEYMVRTRRADANLVFPPRRLKVIPCVGTPGELELFTLVGEVIEDLNGLAQVSVAQALMSSPRALAAQLRNMASRGNVTEDAASRAEAIASRTVESSKSTFLLSFIDQLQRERDDWRLVVFTSRKETQKSLGELLGARVGPDKIGFIRGGSHAENQRAISGYVASPPSVHVLISTDAGTEGLNLQAGNVLVNFDLPWNPMVLEQRIGRVQRLGSEHAEVVVLNLVLKDSVEERVVARLVEKLAVIADSIGDIEGILEGMGDGRGDDEPLVAQIKELVVGSLRGRDVEASLRSIQDSIDRAKRIYEQEKAAVEENLGRLDSMHDDGPPMPVLSPVEPRLDYQSFVLGALDSGEGELEEDKDGRWVHRRQGYAPEEVVFKRSEAEQAEWGAIAGGPRISLYLPGQPAFEKLGEAWRRRSHHAVRDCRTTTSESQESVVSEWLAGFGDDLQLCSVSVEGADSHFHGALIVRAAASVSHDKYEKLFEVSIEPEGIERPPRASEASIFSRPIELGTELVSSEQVGEAVRGGLKADSDIGEFASFYLDRLDEEVEKAGRNESLVKLHNESLTPRISTKVVGAHGAVHDVLRVRARFAFDGDEYEELLQIAPSIGRRIEEPASARCEEADRLLPAACVGTCEISGKTVRRSLLGESGRSGRLALSSHLETCEVSGLTLLPDEMGRSAVSGRLVDRQLLVSSAVSGRLGLADEFVRCEITGADVLADEVAISEVSCRQFRKDEAVQGAHAQLVGHRSEFESCHSTGKLLLPDEGVVSDISGNFYDREIAVTSARSGRIGGPEESVACGATGKVLLSDEVGECMLTRQRVDLDLLVDSEISGTRCRRDLMVVCEVSGVLGTPEELARSAVSGVLVDRRLLEASDLSGELALESELEACAVSGARLLPTELEESSVSGQRVQPSLLIECSVTNRRALRSEMVEDALERGSWMIKSEAAASEVTGRLTRRDRLQECPWDGALRLEDEFAKCSWTGVRVGSSVLSQAGYLAVFDLMGQGAEASEVVDAKERVDFSPAIQVPGIGSLKSLKGVLQVSSPTGSLVAVGGTRSRMFGLSQEPVRFVLDADGKSVGEGIVLPPW
jgi:superfamily II DNA or RNA helicase